MSKTTPAVEIRPARAGDAPAVVAIGRELVADGTSYVFAPDTTDAELERYWMGPAAANYVAVVEGAVRGCYLLEPNHAGRGSHVAHASYAVSAAARGAGLGRAMGEHSIREAKRLGYRAIQFNLVVATNAPAVALWKSLGFAVVGTLPQVFDHRELGLVDAHVMHRFV